jgi:hypothetical protein
MVLAFLLPWRKDPDTSYHGSLGGATLVIRFGRCSFCVGVKHMSRRCQQDFNWKGHAWCARVVHLALLLSVTGCVSSGKLTVARDFEISSSTKVSMAPGDDPEGYGMALENELLAAGFDVAPYELAKSVVRSESTTRYRASGRSGHSASGTEVFARTYLPTAIAVSLRYTVRRYAMKTDCISAYIA